MSYFKVFFNRMVPIVGNKVKLVETSKKIHAESKEAAELKFRGLKPLTPISRTEKVVR